MEKFFKLSENGTTVKQEVLAGITTFTTMAYIIMLNPNLLTNYAVGTSLWNAVFVATILASTIGTLIMAFYANKPFVLAPGMGLNSNFAAVCGSIALAAGVAYEEAFAGTLCIVIFSGVLFVILTLVKVREKIIAAIPAPIRLSITAGIGFMLIALGLDSNAMVYTADGGAYSMLDAFFAVGSSGTKAMMGADYPQMLLYVLTMFIGIIVISAFNYRKVNGSIIYGILGASIFYWVVEMAMGQNPFASLATASFVPPIGDMFELTFMSFNPELLFSLGYYAAIMTVISFCMVDMFDTLGTFIGASSKLMEENGNGQIELTKPLLADSLATCAGACLGTSTVTTYAESVSGIEAGGRTGLTALTAAGLLLSCIFLAPIVSLIPPPATSAALIYVGVLMIGSLKNVNYSDVSESMPVALGVMFMATTTNVGNGIGIALIMYALLKAVTGKRDEVSMLTWVLAILFAMKFFITY